MGMRVLIADDQRMVRAGLRLILETEPDIDVVAEAGDGAEAVRLCALHNPDVVLMDIRMPDVDGIEATRRLRGSGSSARVLVLTTFDLDEYVFQALRAGASGFILKDAPPETLVAAIRTIAAGDAVLAPEVTRKVIEEFGRMPGVLQESPLLRTLTSREREILQLVARGMSNAEIAKALVISETTVKTHVSHVLLKLNLVDRVHAVVFAYESGLVRPGQAGV